MQKAALVLTDEEKTKLTTLARRHSATRRMALRAQIILRCAEGGSNRQVASDLRVHENNVGKWRKRFVLIRLGGLFDGPRPGVPRAVLDEKVEELVTRTLQSKPKGATYWGTPEPLGLLAVAPWSPADSGRFSSLAGWGGSVYNAASQR
ncbi:helix-turn-helix domain-containing protein [bacterium]|nr:helix-turn-helix domain-containing protein [bacterium]